MFGNDQKSKKYLSDFSGEKEKVPITNIRIDTGISFIIDIKRKIGKYHELHVNRVDNLHEM